MRTDPSGTFARRWIRFFALAGMVLGTCFPLSAHSAAEAPVPDVSQYVHRSWKIREGFASGFIETLAQTPDGYLWIGTASGLYRFDGVRNVLWHPPGGQSLPDAEVVQLLAARDGRLWIGTFKGLASWKDGKFIRYPQLDGQDTAALVEGRDGEIWARGLSYSGAGVLCRVPQIGPVACEHIHNTSEDFRASQLLWDSPETLWLSDSKQVWRWEPGPRHSYPLKGISAGLVEDPLQPGAVLVSTRNGLKKVSDRGIEDFQFSGAPPSFTPLNLFCDKYKDLWIATEEKGVIHVHGEHADIFNHSDGLSGDFATSILQDHEGNIWISTFDGLDSFHKPVVRTIAERQGLSNSTVASVLAARDGTVWFGTYGGLNRWQNGEITIYRGGTANTASGASGAEGSQKQVWDANLPEGVAWSLFEDRAGRIWTSTESGIFYFENGRFFPVKNLPTELANSFAEDDTGLWIGFRNKGLYHWGPGGVRAMSWAQLGETAHGQSLFFDRSSGQLWIGFINGGVKALKDGQIKTVFSARDHLGLGTVSQLQGDEDGSVWAATQGGLSRIKNGRVQTLTTWNGLPCDGVHWMTRGKRGGYWLYTPCGLVRIAPAQMAAWMANPRHKVSLQLLDLTDGVRTQPYPIGSSPLVTRTADGQIWFVPLGGVSVFDPQHLEANRLPPPVHIEQITADGQTYGSQNGLRLPPLVHDLTIDYTALSLVAPEKVRFRYKLEGQDRNWREYINDREVQYSNLGPGNYRFLVSASNNSGVWNPQAASLTFSIAPAYWQTKWFLVLCAATLVALLAMLYRFRLNQVERNAEKKRTDERRFSEMQLELAHANRVATLGQFTAAIAHEVNQPLAAIGTNANAAQRWLKGAPPDLEEVGQSLERIVRDVNRAAKIVTGIRDMAQKEPERNENILIRDIATDVIALVADEAGKHGVTIHTQLNDNETVVKGHRIELQQVILNLVMNAAHAMSSIHDRPRELMISSDVLDTRELLIAVRDTGPGLAPDAYDRIFKLYYTSRPGGMGMGLSICRAIVEGHGGRIWAGANQPHGAVFQFTLPIAFPPSSPSKRLD